METLYLLTNFMNDIFIKCLFISILSIIIAGKVLKADIRVALVIIKGIILISAGLNIGYYFLTYFSAGVMDNIWERATGAYSFVFYLMLVPNTVLPLLLLFKKLGRNKYVFLILAFLMDIGWISDLIVVYTTTIRMDRTANRFSLDFLWLMILYGFFIGSIIYAIGRAFQQRRKFSK